MATETMTQEGTHWDSREGLSDLVTLDGREKVTDPEGRDEVKGVRQNWPGQASRILGPLGEFQSFSTMEALGCGGC